jgi:hypothetical protein
VWLAWREVLTKVAFPRENCLFGIGLFDNTAFTAWLIGL